MFKEALNAGDMECFFPLSEQFITQSEPSFCSISSLAMVLNALHYDPNRVWKGVWRWVSEETLLCDSQRLCAHTSDKINADGLSFEDFESLSGCQEGIRIQSFRASPSIPSLIEFRELIRKLSRMSQSESFVICNFSRHVLQQTGDGHYSPIGGYHAPSDSALLLDVARFKYPPYWVSVESLWSAMMAIDSHTSLPRGYFLVSTNSCPAPITTNPTRM